MRYNYVQKLQFQCKMKKLESGQIELLKKKNLEKYLVYEDFITLSNLDTNPVQPPKNHTTKQEYVNG